MKNRFVFPILMLLVAACNLPISSEPAAVTQAPTSTIEVPSAAPPEPTAIQNQIVPASSSNVQPYPDVTSIDTAPQKRAPYGDSYQINRFERPFTQDMVYMPDVDIASFGISEDDTWYYVSIEMIGKNPNNAPGIRFAVELDTNLDSFGDFLITADPPYTEEWTMENIKIYTDTNRDSAGASPSKSDAVFSGDGYDSLIHSPVEGIGNDTDTAWVRINAGEFSTVQIAFKKSFSGNAFFYGVLADAGLKDVARLDYVDYFKESDAGSPVRDNPNYPLKALFAVDNTCFQAVGFEPSFFEPKVCPVIVQPVIAQPKPGEPPATQTTSCQPPEGGCPLNGPWVGEPYCICGPG